MSIDSIKWVLLDFIVVCGNPGKIMPRYWDFPCSLICFLLFITGRNIALCYILLKISEFSPIVLSINQGFHFLADSREREKKKKTNPVSGYFFLVPESLIWLYSPSVFFPTFKFPFQVIVEIRFCNSGQLYEVSATMRDGIMNCHHFSLSLCSDLRSHSYRIIFVLVKFS